MLVELGVAVLLVFVSAVIYEVVAWICEPKNLPPGIRISPLLTLILPTPKLPFIQLAEMGRKFKGVFTIKSGFTNTVVVDNIAVAREALIHRGQDFSGRPRIQVAQLLDDGKDIVSGDYGPSWKIQRKIAHSALRVFGSAQGLLEEKVFEEINYLVERLEKANSQPTNPKNDIDLAVMNVICAIVFGSRYELDDPEFQEMNQVTSDGFRLFTSSQKLEILPLLKYMPTNLMKEINSVRARNECLFGKKLKEHRDTFDYENIRDLTDAFIKARKDAEDEDSKVKHLITEGHMMFAIATVFQAGFDTTSTTLQWAIAYLATYPQVQRRLQQEIDEVIGRNRLPCLKDKGNLPYLRATITETLRLASTVPFPAPHKTIVNTKLQSYNIPKGTVVAFNLWAMHHDPEEWENPFQFDPSRFIDPDGNFCYPKDRSFLAFGAGGRGCLGESLAKAELILFLSHLCHQFTFVCPEDLPPLDLSPSFGVVSHPKPYKVCFIKRD